MLIVNSKTRHSYTLRELLECEYPELLEAAESRCAPTIGKVVDDETLQRIY